jgi:hypothetical protein
VTTYDATELRSLLPAVYLLRDARDDGSPGPLGALLDVVAEQLGVLLDDIRQSYDDHFVETADPWVLPYLGDLVGIVTQDDTRAYVANVVRYRRRKGTAAVLEQLARDMTGWDARAVEMFQHVATTQRLAHPRPENRSFASLRDAVALESVGTAFDPLARNADVRRIASGRGRYNVPNVALFVWRLAARPCTDVPAVRLDARRWSLSPLGDDVALVTLPEAEDEIEHLAELRNVPWPLSRRYLDATLAEHYGTSVRLAVGDDVPVERVRVCDLSDWSRMPTEPGTVALDPMLGRVALADDPGDAVVRATFHVVAAGRLGGGEYARPAVATADATVVRVPGDAATVTAALALLPPAGGAVEIEDNGRYAETPAVAVADGATVVVRAAAGRGPVLALGGDLAVTAGERSSFALDGLRVTGGTVRVTGAPDVVSLRHCTLVPGLALGPDRTPSRPDAPSLVVDAPPAVVTLDHCVTGPVLVTNATAVEVRDGVVDAPRRRAPGTAPHVLVSGSLVAYGPPASPAPRLRARFAGRPDAEVALASVPATAAEAATLLGDALGVPVVLAGERLVVLADVTFTSSGDDPTAAALHLLAPEAYGAVATLGGRLGDLALGPARALDVLLGEAAPQRVELASDPATPDDAAAALGTALGDDAFVSVHDGALLVVPSAASGVAFTEAPDDAATLAALRLATPRHAIAGDLHALRAAPPVRLDAATVVGAVSTREADLVSNSLLTAPLVARRRQVGCVRYSLLPEGSRTPRQHECAPAGTRADFVSLRYGDPAYCRLHRACPDAVRRGADDGGELGAYHELGEPIREDRLRERLDEFLRFSMEAGVLDGDQG